MISGVDSLAYVLTFDPTKGSGLWLRLLERLAIWAEIGIAADVVICCRSDSELVASPPSGSPHRFHILHGRSSFHAATAALPGAISAIAPQLVYMRYNSPYPSMVTVARRWPTVLEIHADDTREWARRPMRYRLMGRLFRPAMLSSVRGYVFVDPELVDSQSFPEPPDGTRTISNGVRISETVDFGGARPREPGPGRLVLVAGTGDRYQGVDKLVQLATLLPELEFHVAGPVDPGDRHAPGNVVFHGVLDPMRLGELLGRMDVGVGNLALEDVGMRRPSPLKVRDYVAAGLPCILAHDDPDLPEQPGVLGIPFGFTPDSQVARRIAGFTADWQGRSCTRAMAEAVDIRRKEADRLDFLRAVVRGRPAQ